MWSPVKYLVSITSHEALHYAVLFLSFYFLQLKLIYHQLDAQTSCLFTYNTLIKTLYMFRANPAHLQEVHFVIVYMRSLVSSFSAGDCLVHRLRKNYM